MTLSTTSALADTQDLEGRRLTTCARRRLANVSAATSIRLSLAVAIALALSPLLALAEPIVDGPWRIDEGLYRVAGPGQSLLYLADEPYIIEEGTIEATVVVKERVRAGGWATAGLLLIPAPGSYWNLGLVEGPDGRHYTELVEDYQGVHQAQSEGALRLPPVEGTRGATWDYGVTYHLRLVLTRESVVGEVYRRGETEPLARHGFLLSGAPAVREGWAALRCDAFDAEFRDVRVTAASRPQAVPSREYPSGRRGCVGIYLGSDMPGASRPPDISGFRKRLADAGFAVVDLTSADLATPGTLTYPALNFLCADLRRLPAVAVQPLMNWMRDGGILVSLTAPAFGEFYWESDGRWLDWDAYVQHGLAQQGTAARPILAWDAEQLSHWHQDRWQAEEAAVDVRPGAGPNGEDALELAVPHFGGGWWSLSRTFDEPPAHGQESLTCFWAKGDANTPAMSLEWAEEDGSRWIAVVHLQPTWRFYALPATAFLYWKDNPSKGRGFPGDCLHLDHARRLAIGISSSHTPDVLRQPAEEHRIWLTSISVAEAPPAVLAAAAPPTRPELEALSPGYKLHEVKDANRWVTTDVGRAWGLPAAQLPPLPALGAVERPCGVGFRMPRWWRWVPLVQAVDASGRVRGAPVSVVLSRMIPLVRSAWISVGLRDLSGLSRTELQAALIAAMTRLLDAPVLYQGGTEGFVVRPGEKATVGAQVVAYGGVSRSATVRFVLEKGRSSRVVVEASLTARPGEAVSVQRTLPGLPVGDYSLAIELVCDGRLVDRIVQPLQVRDRPSSPPRPEEIVVRRDGGLYLDGKPWHPVACNYWPHYLSGIPGGAYGRSFLDPILYDPHVVEADLAQMKGWGFRAITAVGADANLANAEDSPVGRNLEDFLWRCHRHGIKVILFVPGLDPRARDDNVAQTVIRAVRNHPAIAGYDIAWEPHYWGEARRRYAPQWRDWLILHYGSLEAAEQAFGHPLPRDDAGEVTVPTDEQCLRDGPWRPMVAAYRAYMNWQLGAEYRRSVSLVRSLDPYHLVGFRGSTVDSPAAFKPVEQPAVLHFVDWAGPEGYDVPLYGKLTDWPIISAKGLVTRLLSFLSGGKPVIWMEFGVPVYPNGTPWRDDLIAIQPERYEYQAEEGRRFWRMQVDSGAWGSFIWWYPGGFRVGENSDCGLVDPDNAPRPVASVAREFVPKFAASERFSPDTWLEFRPEENIGGWIGEYLRLRDEYARLVEAGHRVGVRTAGLGMTSADCPLIDPAGRPWPGAGPLRYLDAIFESVRVRTAAGPWQDVGLPTAPRPVEVQLAGHGPVEIDVRAANLAEARWLAGPPDAQGSVCLSVSGSATVRIPLEKPVDLQGTGRFGPFRLNLDPSVPADLVLQLEAVGRAPFGEILRLRVRRS